MTSNDVDSAVVIADIAPSAADVEGEKLYKFVAWFKDQACTEAIGDMTVPAGATTTIYAKALDPVTLTFTSTVGTAPDAVTVKSGEAWGDAPTMSDEANVFGGWTTNDTVVAADFWTTPVTENNAVAAKWTAAAASVDGVAYATLALAEAAAEGKALKLQADNLAAITTKAAVLDLNDKKISGNVTFTYAGAVTLKNGENMSVANTSPIITAAAGQNLTIYDVIFHGDVTPKGSGALLTIKNCMFKSDLDLSGKAYGEATGNGHSNDLTMKTDCAFEKVDVIGNSFYMGYRNCIAVDGTPSDIYVYNNTFDATTSALKGGQLNNAAYPAFQIQAVGSFIVENNTFKGEYMFEPCCFYSGNYDNHLVVFSGNTVESSVTYSFLVYPAGGTKKPVNAYWGVNDWNGQDQTQGNYGGADKGGPWSNDPYTTNVNLAATADYATLYAWAHGDDAAKPFCVNGAYVEDLSAAKTGDSIIAFPGADMSSFDTDNYSLNPVGDMKNAWTVAQKATSVIFAPVKAGSVTAIAYQIKDGESGVIDATTPSVEVAAGGEITFTMTVADGNYVLADASGSFTEKSSTDTTFTYVVDADVASQATTVSFNGVPCFAKGDNGILYKEATAAYAATSGDGVKLTLYQNANLNATQLGIEGGKTYIINTNGFIIIANPKGTAGNAAATVEVGTGDNVGYTVYSGFATTADAWAAKKAGGEAVVYIVSDEVKTAGAIELAGGEIFAGKFKVDSYGVQSGSIADGAVVAAAGAALKDGSGISEEGKTFRFEAEATSTDPIPVPVDDDPVAVSNALDNAGIPAGNPVYKTVTTKADVQQLNAIINAAGGFSSDGEVAAAQKANLNSTFLMDSAGITPITKLWEAEASIVIDSITATETAGTYEFVVEVKEGSTLVELQQAGAEALANKVLVGNAVTAITDKVAAKDLTVKSVADGKAVFDIAYGNGAAGFMKVNVDKTVINE